MNVDDETLKRLRTLDVAPRTSLTDAQREVAAARKASILATDPTDREGAGAGAGAVAGADSVAGGATAAGAGVEVLAVLVEAAGVGFGWRAR